LFRNQILSHDNLESFLQDQGTGGSVVCCDSGTLVLDIAQKCGINVAITHVDQDNVPFASSFLKELKESNPALNILAIVLPEHFDCLGDDLENLVDDFITIPIDMSELKIRLRKGLRHSQLVKIEPQPAVMFKQRETGLSAEELIALQLQHESSPLIHSVETPGITVKGDELIRVQAQENDKVHDISSECTAISAIEEELLNSAVQEKTDIQPEGCLKPDEPFEANLQEAMELPSDPPRFESFSIPHLGDSTEIMAMTENTIDGDFAEEMSVLMVNARSREGCKAPKPETQIADKLLESEPLPPNQYQPHPEKLIANDIQVDDETRKGILSKVISIFSAKKSA
jgi:DNA-binding response OmpR family regulator